MFGKIGLAFLTVWCAVSPTHASPHHHGDHILSLHGVAATHTATQSGAWFDAATWAEGSVPGDHAHVVIPETFVVDYAGTSAARIETIQVSGGLHFASQLDSTLLVDTLLVEPTGQLRMGSKENPVIADITITIANNGDIDVSNDPSQLSRGVVAYGEVQIFGAPKTVHTKVAQDPLAGATSMTLAEPPENWRIGDTLVLAGTRYSGWKWDNSIGAVRYHGTQDEVLTITAINDAVISFTPAMQYDHATPRSDLKTSVANFSRHITFATENPETAEVHQRGHMAIMHHPFADVRYAAFHHMGRTDKSRPSFEAADIANMQPDSNVRGRYPFHIHRSGIADSRNPAIAVGLAVFQSPGWGITHHDSNMIVHNSATFDTFGAGIVAETGNEIGSWTNNIAIKAEGNSAFNPKNGNDREAFDMGRSGAGFWFQGRMVRSVNNVAASVNHGYVYLHRGSGMLSFDPYAFMLPEALGLAGNSAPDDAPIFNFHNNEAFASTVGVYVVKANPNQQHDIRTVMSDFTAWEVRAGAAMEYTSHYLLKDFDLIGSTPEPFRDPAFGIDFGTNTTDMSVNQAHIQGFELGVGLGKDFTGSGVPASANQYVLIDTTFTDVTTELGDYDPTIDQILTAADLGSGPVSIALQPESYEYLSPATSAGSGVDYIGTKTDQIGDIPIPAGTDDIGTPVMDMIALCETDGYRIDPVTGTHYMVVEEYFSDRATGEIAKFGLVTTLGQDVVDILGNQFHAWADCFSAGDIDIASAPPVATDDLAATLANEAITIAALDNDTDAEPLHVDGIVNPLHGDVFAEPDGSILYRPDIDFIGTDSFRYWATDEQGHYSPATVTVMILDPLDEIIFADNFAP